MVSRALPAGTYVVNASVDVHSIHTFVDTTCHLRDPSGEFATAREADEVDSTPISLSIALTGAITLDQPGFIDVWCIPAIDGERASASASMTAVRVALF